MPHWRHSNFSRELQTLMISGQMVSFIFLFPTFDNRQIDYFHRKFKANCLCWVHIGLKIKSKCKIFLVFSYKLLIKAKLTLSKMEIIKIIGTLCYAKPLFVTIFVLNNTAMPSWSSWSTSNPFCRLCNLLNIFLYCTVGHCRVDFYCRVVFYFLINFDTSLVVLA